MTVKDQVVGLLSSAMELSAIHSQAIDATQRAIELKNNNQASAVNAWNDLYEKLVEVTQDNPSAQDSKLGQALQKSI